MARRRSHRIPASYAHRILQDAGGVAGARYIAERLSVLEGKWVSVRTVRDRFRNYGGGVRKIGAGYYATADSEAPLVRDFVDEMLRLVGPLTRERALEVVLESFPHGDAKSVWAWLIQEYDIRVDPRTQSMTLVRWPRR